MNPAFEGSNPSLFKKKFILIIANNLKNNKLKKIKGIIYGKNTNIKIEINNKNEYLLKNIKLNQNVNIKLLKNIYITIIKEIKFHPYKKKIIHIDFLIKNEKNI